MEKNILCERKEQVALFSLFEDFSMLLQDSDDGIEKDRIKKALQSMTDTTTYMVLGEEGAGKTTLLSVLFQDILDVADEMAGNICEYRWGEQEFTTPLSDGFQKKFVTTENIRGLSIIDTKGLNRLDDSTLKRINGMAENCDAILVVLEAKHVNSSRLWDIIERIPSKRMVFFLSKCDQIPNDELQSNMEKVKCYMRESGISAPVFPVNMNHSMTEGTVTLDEVRLYIRNQLVGPNPMLHKQMQNVEEVKKMLIELQDSFILRKKQYISDAEILRKINSSLDDYVLNHKRTLNSFIQKLSLDIQEDINKYEKEIISKLDPYKIKERFKNKEDFECYLSTVNENYKNMMNDSVNRKTIEVIKECLHDLEIIFKEAIGYFNERENILKLNDRFYGSLSKSRKEMIEETKDIVVLNSKLYGTLSDASEILFLQIWNERKKYDARLRNREVVSTWGTAGAFGLIKLFAGGAVGSGAGAGSVVAGAGTAGAGTAAAGAAGVGTAGSTAAAASLAGGAGIPGVNVVFMVIIGALVGAVVINSIVKKLYDPKAADKMEEATQQCIEEFKEEVNKTRNVMIKEVSAQITEIFEKELTAVDSYFTDFRISVNVDERKLPVLEQKLIETNRLLQELNDI